MSQKPFHKIFILLGVLLFWGMSANAQTPNTIDSLLCKEWKLVAFEEGGKKIPAQPEQKGDRMIFYFNHKVKSVDAGVNELGIWSYDAKSQMLTITDNESKEKMQLKVLKITAEECELSFKEDDLVIKIYMAPVIKMAPSIKK